MLRQHEWVYVFGAFSFSASLQVNAGSLNCQKTFGFFLNLILVWTLTQPLKNFFFKENLLVLDHRPAALPKCSLAAEQEVMVEAPSGFSGGDIQ